MKSFRFLFSILILLNVVILKGQTVIVPEKKSYEDEKGLLYWNKTEPVYIHLSSSPNEKGHLLKSKIHKKYTNPFYFDTEGINYIRTRYAVDTATRKIVSPHIEVLLEVYADGKAPVSSIKYVDAKKYKMNGMVYFGKGLKIRLNAKDAGSGVDKIYYSLNNSEYKVYDDEIVINSENGNIQFSYYAVDKVGNIETVKRKNNLLVDTKAPETFHNITGFDREKSIVSLNSKLYLNAEDSVTGVKGTYYKYDDGPYILYKGKTLPLKQLDEGEHTLSYYSEDRVGNKEEPKSVRFFLDKSAPILTSDVLGDRFIVNDRIYFSGRTKLKLTAVDNKSGVKEVNYSVDNEGFKKYKEPFYLPKKPGYHVIKYYAIDNMNNKTGKGQHDYDYYKYSTKKIYVDLVGPTLKHSYVGKRFFTRDTVFLGQKSKIKLSAQDAESGLQYIAYSIDGVQKETKYTEPFTIRGNGKHVIEYFGYDNVNNRNIGKFYVFVDEDPPEPICSFSVKSYRRENGVKVYPAYVMIYLSGIDQITGTEQIFYSINGNPEKLYSIPIKGFRKGLNTIRYKTVDKLGNEKYKEEKFMIE